MDKYETIWLWSNGCPHQDENGKTDMEEFKQALLDCQIDFSSGLNVFFNTCVPLMACKERFADHACVSFHRECSKSLKECGFFGLSAINRFSSILSKSYIVANGSPSKVLAYDEAAHGIGQKIDEVTYYPPNAKPYPTDKKNMMTTGFIGYLIERQWNPSSNLVLVNFGVCDKRYNWTRKNHDIDFENELLNELNVDRLTI